MSREEDDNVSVTRRMMNAVFCNLINPRRINEENNITVSGNQQPVTISSASVQQPNSTENLPSNTVAAWRANTNYFWYDAKKPYIITKESFIFGSGLAIMIGMYIGVVIKTSFVTINEKNFRYYMKLNTSRHSVYEIFFEFNLTRFLHHTHYLVSATFFAVAIVIAIFLLLTLKYQFVCTGEMIFQEFDLKARKKVFISYFILTWLIPTIPNFPYHVLSIQNNIYCSIFITIALAATQGFVMRIKESNLMVWSGGSQHRVPERVNIFRMVQENILR